MEIRYISSDDIEKISELVWVVFSEFVAPGYSEEGVGTFKSFVQPEELKKSIDNGRFFILACFEEEKPMGTIAMRDNCHVSLLFVDKEYHGRGIARKLYEEAVRKCKEENPGLDEVTVNSSPYAVEIYKRLGFEITGEQATQNGITFAPMRMRIRR
ncbi:MAG: GNAT family N-acetyltransferase [Bacillota bacterium]|nr:GNAT family N-acetyltransferase [Bacillota bacterium]